MTIGNELAGGATIGADNGADNGAGDGADNGAGAIVEPGIGGGLVLGEPGITSCGACSENDCPPRTECPLKV